MKSSKHYLRTLLVILITLSLLLSACNSAKREERREAQKIEQETPLLVFIVSDYSRRTITNFQMEYPDIELEVVEVNEEAARKAEMDTLPEGYIYTLEDAMEYYTKMHGDPDLIISTTQKVSEKALPAWIEAGWVQDMSQYFGEDDTFNEEDYYPGTAEIGRVDGTLYALPLALNTEYWTLRDEAWDSTAFSSLEEGYTASDLLYCVEEELANQIPLGTDGWVVLDNGCSFMYDTYEWLHKFGALKIADGEITLDKELFTQICRVQSLCMDNVLERDSSFWMLDTTTEPTNAGGKYYITKWSDSVDNIQAPQLGLIHAQSLNEAAFQQGTHVLWLPYKTEDGVSEYAAEVAYWGMIGSQTQRAEEVYEIIRRMMDMPAQSISTVVQEGGITAHIPIHRQNALDMIGQMNESELQTFVVAANGVGSGTVAKVPIDPQLQASMENFLTHITQLYTEDDDAVWEIANVLYQYKDSGGTNFGDCYDTVLSILRESRFGGENE